MVMDRVRLTIDEFHTAVAELEMADSPDPEYEAEKEEKEKREKAIRRRRKLRRKKRQAGEGEDRREEAKGANISVWNEVLLVGFYFPVILFYDQKINKDP